MENHDPAEPYDDPRQREIAQLIDHYDADIDVISGRRRRILWIGIPLTVLLGVLLTLPEACAHRDPKATLADLSQQLGLSIATHLGVGLIVAAIAVFGYEWGSEVKNALVLGWGLRRVLVLTGRTALQNSLRVLLPSNDSIRADIVAFVDAAVMLRKYGDWGRDAYMLLLTDLASAMARAARSVSGLSTVPRLDPRNDSPFALGLPEAARLADTLLSGLLQELGAGDEYYAVSNARIWPPLQRFHETHRSAIQRGVTIHRIFVIFDRSDMVLSPDDTISILYSHFTESRDWTFEGNAPVGDEIRYQMKIITRERYRELAPDLERLYHFGAFLKHGATTLFDVQAQDLSSFVISHGALPQFTSVFKHLWRSLPNTDDELMRKTLLTERIRHMDANGSILAVTRFSDWAATEATGIHKELASRASGARISVKRIFVTDDGFDLVAIRRALSAFDYITDEQYGSYEWRICGATMLKSFVDTIEYHLPFIVFRDATWQSSSGAHECTPDSRPFMIDTPERLELTEIFERLWATADDVPQRQGSFLHRAL
jgi:hypothetical protein